jgi:rubrerythrin
MKKLLKDAAPFTGDLRETFPEYYNKFFRPYRKIPNTDFIFFKYYTDDGKGDDEESDDEDNDDYLSNYEDYDDKETKDLYLKEIELMFENGYHYNDVEKIFPYFYKRNAERINLLYYHVYSERFNRDPTLTVQKDIEIYKVRQDQIEIIEKRKTLKKLIKKLEKNNNMKKN